MPAKRTRSAAEEAGDLRDKATALQSAGAPAAQHAVVLVGVPGAGKSHTAEVLASAGYVRCCQDILKTRDKVHSVAAEALAAGRNVVVDKTNVDAATRQALVRALRGAREESDESPSKLKRQKANPTVVTCVFLDMPKELCEARVVKRDSHEGGVQGGRAVGVVRSMYRRLHGDRTAVVAPPPPRPAGANAFAVLKAGAKRKWTTEQGGQMTASTRQPPPPLIVVRKRGSPPKEPQPPVDSWQPWALALRGLAKPESEDPGRKSTVLARGEGFVVATDGYPKGKVHLLAVAVDHALAGPWAVRRSDHIRLLRSMHSMLKEHALRVAAEKGIAEHDLRFGFHRIPSMAQLHIHCISDDLLGPGMKTAKHYLSFATDYFVPFDEALAELERDGAWYWQEHRASYMARLETRPLPCHVCARREASARNPPDYPSLSEGFDAVITCRTVAMAERVAAALASDPDGALERLDAFATFPVPPEAPCTVPSGPSAFAHVPKLVAHLKTHFPEDRSVVV